MFLPRYVLYSIHQQRYIMPKPYWPAHVLKYLRVHLPWYGTHFSLLCLHMFWTPKSSDFILFVDISCRNLLFHHTCILFIRDDNQIRVLKQAIPSSWWLCMSIMLSTIYWSCFHLRCLNICWIHSSSICINTEWLCQPRLYFHLITWLVWWLVLCR